MAGEDAPVNTILLHWSGFSSQKEPADDSIEPAENAVEKFKEPIQKLELFSDWSFQDLKLEIYSMTSVRPEHQKLLSKHLKYKGKVPPEDLQISELDLPQGIKIKLLGKTEEEINGINESHSSASSESGVVLDDFEWDYLPGTQRLWNLRDATRALRKMIKKTVINVINPPRQDKPVLVLDLDHTLLHFSTKSVGTYRHHEMMRPYMHEFLTKAYVNYDIVIWSQTSWTWVEIKLTELGMLNHPGYKISFALDKTQMFKVVGLVDGSPRKFRVKALGLIWAKFDQWNLKNTIHIDDLAKNFAMNPECGLRCSRFNRPGSKNPSKNDNELFRIAQYLDALAKTGDFTQFNHNKWEKYLKE